MKVVVNKCHGGFGLSLLAQKRLAELQGREVFFYTQTKFEYNNNGISEYEIVKNIEEADDLYIDMTNKYLGDIINEFPDGTYYYESYSDDDKRCDPDLIRVVEELGEASWGSCANLEVVEIPDDIRWSIGDYDGYETIREHHRSW